MKGICFKEPLFHLTVQGEKTQTRRIINNQPDARGFRTTNVLFEDWHGREARPRYKVGETVYLKEPYHLYDEENNFCFYKYPPKEDWLTDKEFSDISASINKLKGWKNKLFMPEKYARHFIKITAVRAERLQGISDEDCIKEGIIEERPEFWNLPPEDGQPAFGVPEMVTDHTCYATRWFDTPQEAYAVLIDGINGPGTWESNPWTWVIDYNLTNSPAI